MKSRTLPALALLLAAGALRLPIERALTADFRDQGLLSEPLELGLREKIGQNSSAVALAGLRTLVASFTHLQATEAFGAMRWYDLEKAMNTTVQLAPRGSYYWDMGGWHLAYNASSSALTNGDLPPLRAKAESQRWIAKGRAFFERGCRNNPRDWRMHAALGRLLSDSNRAPDDPAAAEAFAKAIATGEAPPSIYRYRLFAEARAGRDPAATFAEVRALLAEPGNRVPTLLGIYYSLGYQISPPDDPLARVLEIFGTEDKALRNLGAYFTDVKERLPRKGVETAVRLLERRKGIAPEDRHSFIRQREEFLELHGLSR